VEAEARTVAVVQQHIDNRRNGVRTAIINRRFTLLVGRCGLIYPQLSVPAKDWVVHVRFRRTDLLNKIGFGILTSSVVLVASTLLCQAAIIQEPPTGNKSLEGIDLRSADLSSETDPAPGHKLKLRLLTLEPGGVVELHNEKDHPTLLHVIKGILTSHSRGKPEVVLRAGVGLAGAEDGNFWVENTGSEPAEFIWLPVYESAP
jgi:quercetin dioxygenase-like cupin family protein